MGRSKGAFRAIIVSAMLGFSTATAIALGPLSFGIDLSPTTQGSIDGKATLALAWTPWLSSELEGSSETYSLPIERSGVTGSVSSSTRSLVLEAAKIDQDLLWAIVKKRLDFLEFSAGIAGKAAWRSTEETGYDSAGAGFFYLEEKELRYLKPLVDFSLGLSFPPIKLSGYGVLTPIATYEDTDGTILNSVDAIKTPYTKSEIGYDGQYGGSLSLAFGPVRPTASVDYFIHSGATTTYSTGSKLRYVYQHQDLSVGLDFILGFIKTGAGSPLVGGAWVTSTETAINHSELDYRKSRFRIDLGFRY
jgi:hypothetical protein